MYTTVVQGGQIVQSFPHDTICVIVHVQNKNLKYSQMSIAVAIIRVHYPDWLVLM